jgi:hypothetical protein
MEKERIVKVEVSLQDNILGRDKTEVYEFPWDGHTEAYEAAIKKHWSRFAGSDWELMGMKIIYVTPMNGLKSIDQPNGQRYYE